MEGHLYKWKDICISYFETNFSYNGGYFKYVYCLPDFLLHMTTLKIFWKVDSIRRDYTTSNRKWKDVSVSIPGGAQ